MYQNIVYKRACEERGGGKGRLNKINSNNVLNKVSLII